MSRTGAQTGMLIVIVTVMMSVARMHGTAAVQAMFTRIVLPLGAALIAAYAMALPDGLTGWQEDEAPAAPGEAPALAG